MVLLQFVVFAVVVGSAVGVIPTGKLDFDGGGSVETAPASFGRVVPTEASALQLTLRWPGGLLDGCDPEVSKWAVAPTARDGVALLAARSPNCTFEDRAVAAAGAGITAVVVYNTIEGIYRNRSAAEDKSDYECDNGRSTEEAGSKQKSLGFPESACALDPGCDSGRCLVTGEVVDSRNVVCCAWDNYMTMGAGANPQVYLSFLRMRDVDLLTIGDVKLYDSEDASYVDLSSICIWLLAVATCAFAAWKSADETRRKQQRWTITPSEEDPFTTEEEEEESGEMELTAQHAIGFICVASVALLVLFYVKLSGVIVVAFALSSASSTTAVFIRPTLERLNRRCLSKKMTLFGTTVSGLDATSLALGCSLSATWLYARAQNWAFSWVLQDLFGVCLCVLFLSLIKVNSLKVASTLLTMAFCYDIFFVFLSPYFFGSSVMVQVASGDGPTMDPDYCENYPSDAGCQTTQLPMLLLLPSNGGYTMLGLGDIVLPGLLVSLAARYDAATGRSKYFLPLVAGYALGLAVANMAVAMTGLGQPALLYLVPSTLGLFLLLAKQDGAFDVLWHGPPSLKQSSSPPPPPQGAGRRRTSGGGNYEEIPNSDADNALLKNIAI